MFPRPRLPLRTKVSVFFGLLALVTTVTLAVVTYGFARRFVLDERRTESQREAIDNARGVRQELAAGTEVGEIVLSPARPDGFSYATTGPGNDAPSQLGAVEAFPPELKAAVDEGIAGLQRFRYEGDLYIGVGIPLAEVGAKYFEAFPLDDTERDLRNLLLALAVGATAITLLAATLGVWTSRRLLKPLDRITAAASKIAEGDLDTRLAYERDPDLVPIVKSFNGMADSVQARIQREVRFASDVSHELRSPITALAAATDLIDARREELPPRTQQAIDVIVSQVRRFDGMVLDLLELSRIDAGAADLHLESVELAELCRRMAVHRGFPDLPIVADPEAAQFARVDRVRFERIFGNLLDNAQQHASGPVRIAIEPAPTPFVDVAVEDAGPGVGESEREEIFQRFTRGSGSLHRAGTGLGLALVAEHAMALGGAAWVEDRPGGGARFVVRLRAARRRHDETEDES